MTKTAALQPTTPSADAYEPLNSQRPAAFSLAPVGVVSISILFHGAVAWGLGAIPVEAPALTRDSFVSFSIEASTPLAPLPPIVPEAPPPPPVVEARHTPRVERPASRETPPASAALAQPTPVEPPAAEAMPSADELFGEPAPAETLVAAGGGDSGFRAEAGTAGGVGGPGAHGTRLGGSAEGASGGTSVTGPSVADRRRARRDYVRSLEGLLRGRVEYPRTAVRNHVEGRVELCLRVGPGGEILAHRVCESAGASVLDEAALAAAARLARVPAPPALAAWSATDEIHTGIAFVLR